jgi:hypothetical protein
MFKTKINIYPCRAYGLAYVMLWGYRLASRHVVFLPCFVYLSLCVVCGDWRRHFSLTWREINYRFSDMYKLTELLETCAVTIYMY